MLNHYIHTERERERVLINFIAGYKGWIKEGPPNYKLVYGDNTLC